MINTSITTFGALKQAGVQYKSIRQEIRENLIANLKKQENVFHGILGFEDTVIPDIERALLSGHNLNLLGLRGQAKTRMARQMTNLLDEYVPVVKGSEINDDPFKPISKFARNTIEKLGDATPIEWLHRDDRYAEKLATPDVSVADLIGDIDPIKAANMKLSFSDEEVLHYGIIPRSNRCIFVINELPDLQPRIQVSLFNILQEGDIQIRGFKLRMPLDIQFVFTSNPEDYTNRGSIITPLKDRIGSQILTHYPKSIDIAKSITYNEAKRKGIIKDHIYVPEIARSIIEQIAIEARKSEFVDQKSGVSARLSISAFENLISAAERRMLTNNESSTSIRLTDFVGVIPAITGKIEMVYEGEQEGPFAVAQNLMNKALRTNFIEHFPEPDKMKRKQEGNPYKTIVDWFAADQYLDLLYNDSSKEYELKLLAVEPLKAFVEKNIQGIDKKDLLFMMEYVLFGLAEYSRLSRNNLTNGTSIRDVFANIFTPEE
jgi:magnesium chelatase subunit I